MGIKAWNSRRVSLKAGQISEFRPSAKTTNALLIINRTTATISVATTTDPVNYPEWKVGANGTAPVVLPHHGASVNLYSGADAIIIVVEIAADDINMIFAMQVTISDVSTFDLTDKATRQVGKTGIQVAGADVAAANPVPVTPGTGAVFDVSDRAARAAGKVGIQVAAADVAAANPVPVTPGTGATFDVSDRAARALGTVTVDKVTGILSTTISADNAAATITLAAPGAGVAHYVWGIIAGFVGGAATKLLTVKDGATVKENIPVVNSMSSERTKPLKITDATALEVSLAASGTAGVIGYVTVLYETR